MHICEVGPCSDKRVYDEAGNVIATHEQRDEVKEQYRFCWGSPHSIPFPACCCWGSLLKNFPWPRQAQGWRKRSSGAAHRRNGKISAYTFCVVSFAGSSCLSFSRWPVISKRNAKFSS